MPFLCAFALFYSFSMACLVLSLLANYAITLPL